MKYTILLSTDEKTQEVEAEEQIKFVLSILDYLDIPFEWDSNGSFGLEEKIRLKKQLKEYNISVIDDMDGGLKIYVDASLIGEWKKPFYKLKQDLSEIDPKKQLYMEMNLEYTSVFDTD